MGALDTEKPSDLSEQDSSITAWIVAFPDFNFSIPSANICSLDASNELFLITVFVGGSQFFLLCGQLLIFSFQLVNVQAF